MCKNFDFLNYYYNFLGGTVIASFSRHSHDFYTKMDLHFYFISGTAAVEPAMVSIPPVSHWSTLYTVPVKGNTLYDILIISRNPQVKVSSNLFPAPADLNALAALAAIGTPGAYNFVPVSPVSPGNF